MTMLTPYVVESLASLEHGFKEGELAYLALTSKVEHAIRDCLAFSLHGAFAHRPELLVCREWKRFDLAVIENDSPRLILEAKAFYTFDILKTGVQHPYAELLQRDINKAILMRSQEVLALLVATHPHAPPNRQYSHAVKYFRGVSKRAVPNTTVADADKEVRRRFQNLPLVAHREVSGGEAFGVGVSVAYWLFRASPKDA